jgi:hypothetical protein
VVTQVSTQRSVLSIAAPEGSLLTPCELAPPARAIIGDNGLKEVQKGALVDSFILTDLNRPRCPVPLSLVNNALGIAHDGVVDENCEMILRSQQRADVALQRKIGLLGALDGLGHLRVGGISPAASQGAYECIRRCGSRSGRHSWKYHTTHQGPSAWLTGEDASPIASPQSGMSRFLVSQCDRGHLKSGRIEERRRHEKGW